MVRKKIIDFIFENNRQFPTMLNYQRGGPYRKLSIDQWQPEISRITLKYVISEYIPGVGYNSDFLTNYTQIVEGFFPLFWSQFNLTAEL